MVCSFVQIQQQINVGVKTFFCDVNWNQYTFKTKEINRDIVLQLKCCNFIDSYREFNGIKFRFIWDVCGAYQDEVRREQTT